MASTRDDTLAAIYARGDRLRSSRRRRRLAALGAGVVVCIVAGVVLWPRGGHRAQSVATTPATTVPSASVSALETGQWSEIPDPPVAWVPNATQGVWAGSELVVWGVLADHNMAAAAFDPVSRAWHNIAAPPLSPRVNASVVWTGSEVVVWGGIGFESRNLFNDGAAYDPARSSWRPLAASPLAARSGAAIVWTGSEAVVLGGTNLGGTLVDGARYDPSADKWHRIAALPNGDHTGDTLTAVWAGDRAVVADLHEKRTQVDPTTTGFDDGVSFSSYDLAQDSWSALPSTGAPQGVAQLIWTGTVILSPAAQIFCGSHSCPFRPSPAGSQLDPETNTWRPIAQGPVDDGDGVNVWTGSALFRVTNTRSGTQNFGDAAGWDPTTDSWTRLERAPLTLSSGDVVTWTGREVLIWGTAYDRNTGSRPAGLLFTPHTKPPITPTTPSEVAAQLKDLGGVDPILVPTAVPAGWGADVSVSDARYEVTYHGPNDESVHLSVSIPNPPPPTDTGTQEFGFRGDPQGMYQQQDANDPFTDRYLLWNESGHWTGDGTAAPSRNSVPYYLWSKSVTDSVFWQIADTLTALPLPPPPTTPTMLVDPNSGLHDGQQVRLVLTGFPPLARVRLSECGSSEAVNGIGCGAQLARQPFADLDQNGNGAIPFTITSRAATQTLDNSPTVACIDQCVLVATSGAPDGPTATAPLSFG